MPTQKKRINLSIDSDTLEILELISKNDAMPVTSKALQLIQERLEQLEDEYLVELAEQSLSEGREQISHENLFNEIQNNLSKKRSRISKKKDK